MPQAIERYLEELRAIRRTGAAVPETSYYQPLANLLNAIGADLETPVLCVINPANRGAGIPDGGLFTDQAAAAEALQTPQPGRMPERGVIEVKPVADDAFVTADSSQVSRYVGHYGLILVTNFRDFILLESREGQPPLALERYRLADSEAEFWQLCEHPAAAATRHGHSFDEYLKRAMQHGAPIERASDVAWFLASYARDSLARIDRHSQLEALAGLRTALEEGVGFEFTGPDGEHFFRSALVQTLFYGMFSAWVLWHEENPSRTDDFDWRTAGWTLRVPMIRGLFEQIATRSRLEPLGLVEPLEWTGRTLNRVRRGVFFTEFQTQDAVQYFYEPFLEQFDPDLRRQLGVWYTPLEIIRYIVARVDALLRDELDVEGGLANPNVYVLDPCCGTGAFLVEVLRTIQATLEQDSGDGLVGSDVNEAARTRVFGFEILPAPFVIAHLQLGLLLQQLGAPLQTDGDEPHRAAVYLTNALTGWQPPLHPRDLLPFPEILEERNAANAVKQNDQVIVILGNPPYDGFASVAVHEEQNLIESYRHTERGPQPEGAGLNDPYVRFFARAEHKIVQQARRGIISFISNSSWLDGKSHPGIREHFLQVFNSIRVDNLHGNRIVSERAPDGQSSETIFARTGMSSGIEVGTAIVTLVKRPNEDSSAVVLYRDLHQARANARRQALLDSLEVSPFDEQYRTVEPQWQLGYPFTGVVAGADYLTWPLLTDLFPEKFTGVTTSRDPLVVSFTRERLEQQIRHYFDPSISDQEIGHAFPVAMRTTPRFDAPRTRAALVARGYRPDHVFPYIYRPFDRRFLYWEMETKLLDEKRREYRQHVFDGNVWLTSTGRTRREQFYQPQVSSSPFDRNVIEANAQAFPLFLRGDLHDTEQTTRPNLTQLAESYLNATAAEPRTLFDHTFAILHAPAYEAANSDGLRNDWPRIPLPADPGLLNQSAALGAELTALLDVDHAVNGVSTRLRALFRSIARIQRVDGRPVNPAADLVVNVGWGRRNRQGVGSGDGRVVEREYTSAEMDAIANEAGLSGLSVDDVLRLLGGQTVDVYLNAETFWGNVPARVWDYVLGGHPVFKRWLSYREVTFYGGPLTRDDSRTFSEIAHRVAAIRLMEDSLDANYNAVAPQTWTPAPTQAPAG